MADIAVRRIKVGDTIVGRGQVLPDSIKEEDRKVLRARGSVLTGISDSSLANRLGEGPTPRRRIDAVTAADDSAGGADEGADGPAPTDNAPDEQEQSERSSISDEYPRQTSSESSWYELSNGEKVQGYENAVEAEAAIQEDDEEE